MRISLASLMFLSLVIAVPASGQSFVEAEVDGTFSTKLMLEKMLGNEDGVEDGLFVYTQAQKHWAQIYGGFYVKPISWIKFSMGFGVETAGSKARFAPSIWVGNDRVSSFTLYESGGSGHWYKHETTAAVWHFNAGVFSQHLVGTGPFFEIPLPYRISIAGGVGLGKGAINPLIEVRRVIF